MNKLSVIIPSRTGFYLQKTIDDLLEKASGEIQVIAVLDGYWPDTFNWFDSRINIIHHGTPENPKGMRAGINKGMADATGDYVMKLDEHCMFERGFDEVLKANCEDNWVVVPRRYRLDADKWEIIVDGRPPIDYMFIENQGGYLHGTLWNEKARERKDVMVDDLMTFQGSCYFMKKKYWDELMHPMDEENYGQFSNEAQEIGNKCWLSGGRVVVNKNTWYAHWYRGRTGHNFTAEQRQEFSDSVAKGRAYAFDYWTNNKWEKRVHDYQWLLDKFAPLPK